MMPSESRTYFSVTFVFVLLLAGCVTTDRGWKLWEWKSTKDARDREFEEMMSDESIEAMSDAVMAIRHPDWAKTNRVVHYYDEPDGFVCEGHTPLPYRYRSGKLGSGCF